MRGKRGAEEAGARSLIVYVLLLFEKARCADFSVSACPRLKPEPPVSLSMMSKPYSIQVQTGVKGVMEKAYA